ncbi:hypothetical protein AAGS40_23055 [Paraburkholderia sp. PREW-6R]|uniref:hypothetical protein n=1 Tax=Paraburkholderia sp. PREW-6R TaxID=3141544 RepID=UPI0031F4C8A3
MPLLSERRALFDGAFSAAGVSIDQQFENANGLRVHGAGLLRHVCVALIPLIRRAIAIVLRSNAPQTLVALRLLTIYDKLLLLLQRKTSP